MLKGKYIISSRRLGQEEQREASGKVVKYSDDLMHPGPAGSASQPFWPPAFPGECHTRMAVSRLSPPAGAAALAQHLGRAQ